jgi:ankyrin repeat protein
LFAADNVESVQNLLDQRCDLTHRDKEGQTAIFAAAAENREDVLGALLAAGTAADVADNLGRSALHMTRGRACTRLLLDARATANSVDAQGRTALFAAAERSDLGMLSALIHGGVDANVADANRETALFVAAACAEFEFVRVLVQEAFADPTHQNKEGMLAHAIARRLPNQGDRERVADFLAMVSINGRDSKGNSPNAPKPASKRRRYCIVFDDPSDPTGARKIPFQSAEYEAALRRLSDACPWLQMELWDINAPLTAGH